MCAFSIICSANVTRQNFNDKSNASGTSNCDDDNNNIDDDNDDEFFKQIKLDIDRNLLLHSKENYKPNSIRQDIFSLRRKRPIIDEETQNIIKRFRKDSNINVSNFVQTPVDTSTKHCNCVIDSIMRSPHKVSTNIDVTGNVMRQDNLFTSKVLNTHLRNPNKYVFQMTSRMKKNNILPLPKDKTTVLHTECEEVLQYEMIYLTPPNNLNEDQ
ncbi:uncharacterized protein LOC143174181 isoform X2 [Nomia melanderi]|uniref:uncharacterized protein LOC143174181 isoform X2 n=1 Tax=Nomia melanderi TaxID=2448451 RepID=UPI003FCEC5A4